ncbi:related to H+-transporting ATP synthase inhibitor precursor, mitochondrial [Cephalotrichum gorgonifer]|uniref:ATPase inhibitor, mitochondrial n=1 Tax=Cephalotrichum gorgonifer TaxID=2041049 RepID=A0AAE8SU44_9PEZI|nr:related to H+-transporting ATP synthase inhibitor precursor, mitochondrial [Cephalotrichum gorgonifer]
MFRSSIVKAPLRTPAAFASRAFSTTARVMGAGDTGAPPKTGGLGDAFQRRERAVEEVAIRQREREKLIALKKQITEQQAHLQKLSDHIDDITKDQGGEQN